MQYISASIYIGIYDTDDFDFGGEGPQPGRPTDVLESFVIGNWHFYFIDIQTTGATGMADFDNGWLVPSSEAVYALVEIASPHGYVVDPADAITLFSYVPRSPINGYAVRTISDNITISNMPMRLPQLTIPISKTIQNLPENEAAPEFTFNLVQVTDATGTSPMHPPREQTITIDGAGTGHFTLTNLPFGTHYFMISEEPGDAPNSWVYDDTVHIVQIVIRIDDYGVPYYTINNLTIGDGSIRFVNTFIAPGDTVIGGLKIVEAAGNIPPNDETFTFIFERSNEYGVVYESGPNQFRSEATSIGAGPFSTIVPGLEPGSIYYFKVTEQPGANPHWTYDPSVFVVRVEMVVTGIVGGNPSWSGQITQIRNITDPDNIVVADDIVFVNEFHMVGAEFSFHKTNEQIFTEPQWNNLTWVNNNLLSGARFNLYRYTGTGTPAAVLVTQAMLESGDWERVNTNVEESSGLFGEPITFYLTPGSYYQLHEIFAPADFQVPFGQWRLKVNPSAPGGIEITPIGGMAPGFHHILCSLLAACGNDCDEGGHWFVGNQRQFQLPLSGGMGITGSLAVYFGAGFIVLAFGTLAFNKFKYKGASDCYETHPQR